MTDFRKWDKFDADTAEEEVERKVRIRAQVLLERQPRLRRMCLNPPHGAVAQVAVGYSLSPHITQLRVY